MSKKLDRAEIGTTERSWRGKALDTLQSLRQVPETVTRKASLTTTGGNVEDIDPPEDIDELVELYYDLGFIRKNINEFTSDVTEPGVTVESEHEPTQDYFMGGDNAPESAPDNGFLSEAFVFDQKRQHFNRGLEYTVKDRWRRGTVLVEFLYEDDEDPESIITGFKHIRPETVSARTKELTNELIAPEDTETADMVTKRGEAAAFVQFDETAIISRRFRRTDGESGVDFSDKTSIPKSQNDVLKQTLDQDIGGSNAESGVFGESIIRSIRDAAEEYQNISRTEAKGIQKVAFGTKTVQFNDYVIDAGDEKILVEWDENDIQDAEAELEDLDAGANLTTDAKIDLNRFAPDLPDLDGPMRRRAREIVDPLPAPFYKHSFADEINQFVTEDQRADYQDLIRAERNLQAESWESVFREMASRHPDLQPDTISVTIAPDEDESPVMSLSDEDVERIESFASAMSDIFGPGGAPTFIDEQVLRELILQLPEDSELGDEDSLGLEDIVEEVNP